MGRKKLQWESVQTIQLSEESFITLCHSPAFSLGYVFFFVAENFTSCVFLACVIF